MSGLRHDFYRSVFSHLFLDWLCPAGTAGKFGTHAHSGVSVSAAVKIVGWNKGWNKEMRSAFSSRDFAFRIISRIVGSVFEVSDALDRPAAYYVQEALFAKSPKPGRTGVEVRMTGVSRNGRSVKVFHRALM